MKKNKEMQYYVRKSWDDIDTQAGIDYSFFANAKKACDKLEGYAVFNSDGKQVYPEIVVEAPIIELEIGTAVKLLPGVTYSSGKVINPLLFNEKLYIVNIDDTAYSLSRSKDGIAIGRVDKVSVEAIFEDEKPSIDTFIVQINENNVPLYMAPNRSSKIINYINKYSLYTIINEKDGFGKIKKGLGWIDLNQARKMV